MDVHLPLRIQTLTFITLDGDKWNHHDVITEPELLFGDFDRAGAWKNIATKKHISFLEIKEMYQTRNWLTYRFRKFL